MKVKWKRVVQILKKKEGKKKLMDMLFYWAKLA